MINKNWLKRIGSLCFQAVAWLPVFIIVFQLFRLGSWDLDLTLFTNPFTSIFSSICDTLNVNSDTLLFNIIAYVLSWNLFIEFVDIIYLALLYFISQIKSFLCRD